MVCLFIGGLAAVVILTLPPQNTSLTEAAAPLLPPPGTPENTGADTPPNPTAPNPSASGQPPAQLTPTAHLLEQQLLMTVSRLYRWMIIPASTIAVALGVVLMVLDQPKALLRLRWLQVKLWMLAAGLPAMHIGSILLMRAWRRAVEAQALDAVRLRQQLGWATLGILVFLIAVTIIGRLKPRFAQHYRKRPLKPESTTASATAILAALCLTTVACATQPTPPDWSTRGLPHDFALQVTILSNTDAHPTGREVPAQHILDAARRFRAATGTLATENLAPPIIRTLSPADRNDLWRFLVQTGLAERMEHTRDRPMPLIAAGGDSQAAAPDDTQTWVAVRMTAFGSSWMLEGDPEVDTDLRLLAEVMLRLRSGLPVSDRPPHSR